MSVAEKSAWFRLGEQTPWEPGEYEVIVWQSDIIETLRWDAEEDCWWDETEDAGINPDDWSAEIRLTANDFDFWRGLAQPDPNDESRWQSFRYKIVGSAPAVIDEKLFQERGGLTAAWGSTWHHCKARDLAHARELASLLV